MGEQQHRWRRVVAFWAIIVTMVVSLGGPQLVQAAETGATATTSASTVDASLTAIDSALSQTRNYVQGRFADADSSTQLYGSEWMIMDLARDDPKTALPLYTNYYNSIASYLKENNGELSSNAYTEYSRVTLALTALGINAQSIGGYDLFDYLSDYQKTIYQGINGAIFALIAVNSNPQYHFTQPAGVTDYTTKEKLVDYIISKELSDGGWALFGSKSDPDITSMALQALAPFKNTSVDANHAVTNAIDKGVGVLASMENSDGSYTSWGTVNSNSTAQVVTALAALGINPTSGEFDHNGNNPVTALLSYHVNGSGFMYTFTDSTAKTGTVNGMATEQDYYALIAYRRYLTGATSLYNMSDTTLTTGQTAPDNSGDTDSGSDKSDDTTPSNQDSSTGTETNQQPSTNTQTDNDKKDAPQSATTTTSDGNSTSTDSGDKHPQSKNGQGTKQAITTGQPAKGAGFTTSSAAPVNPQTVLAGRAVNKSTSVPTTTTANLGGTIATAATTGTSAPSTKSKTTKKKSHSKGWTFSSKNYKPKGSTSSQKASKKDTQAAKTNGGTNYVLLWTTLVVLIILFSAVYSWRRHLGRGHKHE